MTALTVPDARLFDQLAAIVGDRGMRWPGEGGGYFEDPRGRFTGKGAFVLLPRSTDEVAQIVRACATAGIAVIPYSGGTGVVAGQLSIDSDTAVIVSLERMNRVRAILPDDGVMIAEAGCILENVHKAAAEHGMSFPLGMASKGSCCIGGNLATNAGGIQVVRHGNARDLCLGIEAVLPDGSVLSDLSPLRKNNTGYDLRHLLIGSEGTLGIITAATLVLKPLDAETATVLCALGSPGDALRLYQYLRRELGETISALELMSGFGMALVTGAISTLTKPFEAGYDWFLLIEAGGAQGIGDRLQAALAQPFEDGLVLDAVVAQSEAQRRALWDLRENTPEANRLSGAFCSSDTSVPISAVEGFIDGTHRALAAIHPALRINTYGHIGDGNIHHNVLPPDGVSKTDFLAAHPGIAETVRMAINDVTRAFDGSISAEHGIGRLKVGDLEHYASDARLTALRRIKEALDPAGIMNPGALLR